MAFGVLFDFTGNTNLTKVIKTKDMIAQPWFNDTIHSFPEPIDLFLLTGHNVPRPANGSSNTLSLVKDAIRAANPGTPIQVFGGHSHVRDFVVFDGASTGLEAGRYCETLGWLSMSGFDGSNSGFKGAANPDGVPNPTRKAVKVKSNTTTTAVATSTTASSTPSSISTSSPFVYARRYLDWNRYTFAYHTTADGKKKKFDTAAGLEVTADLTEARVTLNLGEVYGCVPDFYCMTCVAFNDSRSIFTLLSDALATVVVSPNRTDKARIIISNTGGIRFDLYKGPFTFDDNFIVSPFRDVWRVFPDVPYATAMSVLPK